MDPCVVFFYERHHLYFENMNVTELLRLLTIGVNLDYASLIRCHVFIVLVRIINGAVSWFLILMEFVCIKDSSTLFHIESVYIYCKWVRTGIIIYEVILVFNMSITLLDKLVFMNWLIYIYIDNVESVCHKDWSTLYIFIYIYINVRMYKPWYQLDW